MSTLIKAQIQARIASMLFSDSSKVFTRVSEIIVKDGNIGFSIDIHGIDLEEAKTVQAILTGKLQEIAGVNKINIVLTKSKDKNSKIVLDNINKVRVVAAGKGGVGKSTISALLAQKLASQGQKVGLLDADIYGPSIPNIFGLQGKPELLDKRMVPLYNYGIKINSIGFITDPLSSISWRGPMVSKALYQLISLTDWGQLDYLIIDTPPGTGDLHLSLLQNYFISGAIMVTTPQKISAIDVRRTINLYKKFTVPIIGIIENMSCYIGRNSSEKINIFPGDSGRRIAVEHSIPFIAEIPLNTGLASACDQGGNLAEYFDLIQLEQLL